MSEWKDTTSYCQGDHERKPTTWSYSLPHGLRITVTSSHLYHPGEWVMHCAPWFDTFPLKGISSAADAQIAALDAVRKRAKELYAALER